MQVADKNSTITMCEPDKLLPYAGNARKHSSRQLNQLVASLREFGFVNPVLVDANNMIIAGHGRVSAAKKLGLTQVPTLRIDHLSEAQKKAYIIADNRLAELAGWDNDLLKLELKELISLDFNVELSGFLTGEADILIDGPESKTKADPADVLPDIPVGPAVSVVGDLWLLGEHRVLCGDATKHMSYVQLMDNKFAQMIFTDPPYNVPIQGHVCGAGSIKHREFVMASGEMSSAQFTGFLHEVMHAMCKVSHDGAIHYICMDYRHLKELLDASMPLYGELKQLCVWNKDNAGMGTFYRSKHELIAVFKNGKGKHINNFGLGDSGRYRSNVWDYPGANSIKNGSGRKELEDHPTPKCVAMVADAIRDCSKRGGIILDPFLGGGTTVIAAERTGRIAYGIELDPLYVDLTIRRWQLFTGKQAILATSGKSFDETADERVADKTKKMEVEG
jgi:DNA modification methylase